MPNAQLLPRRKVGAWTLAVTIFFVVSGGPFTTEQIIGKAGPLLGIGLLLVIPLVWALPVGIMTADLSSAFQEEGGYYVWVKSGLGPFAGFLSAWWSWLSSWVDLALYPLLAVNYALRLVKEPSPTVHYLLVVGCIAVFTGINMLGIKAVGKLSVGIVLVMAIPFAALIGFAIARVAHTGLPTVEAINPKLTGNILAESVVLALWNYFGWDSLTTASGEVQASSKVFPRAITLALGITVAAVVVPVLAGIAVNHDWRSWNNDDGYWPEIAASAWGPLKVGMVAAGTISGFGLFAANLLASSRIPFVLSSEGYLPTWLTKEHPKYKTPWAALGIAAIMCAFLAQDRFEVLVGVDLALYLAALCLEFVAWISLRKTKRIPGSVLVAIGITILPVLVAAFALIATLSPGTELVDTSMLHVQPWALLLILLATGPVVYRLTRHRRQSSIV